jgi:hypothetical protein
MKEKKEKSKVYKIIEKIIELIVLLSFIALTYYVGSHHEHWADEAQAWLIARDSSWLELFTVHMKYEGSPVLWHVILKALISMGLTYKYYFIVPIVFTSIGVAIVEFKSKMPLLVKIMLPFAYYIFYQYTIVARSYCLIFPALMFLTCVYNDKTKKPLLFALGIILLMNISTHMMIVAAGMCLVYGLQVLNATRKKISKKYYEDKLSGWKLFENWFVIVLLIACFLVVAYFLIPPKDQSEVNSYGNNINYGYITSVISDSLVTNTTEFVAEGIDKIRQDTLVASIVAAVAAVLAFACYFRDRKFYELLVLWLPLYLFLVFYYCNKWHIGMLFEVLVFCLMVHQKLDKINFFSLVFCAICGVQIYYSWTSSQYDINRMYSASEEIANFIKNSHYEDVKIYGVGYSPTAIEPYFEENIFDNKKNNKGYYEWKNPNPNYMTIDEIKKDMPDIIILSAFRDYAYLSVVNRTESSNLYDKYYFEGATYVKDGVYENEGFYVYVSLNMLKDNMTNVERVVFDN